MRAMLLCAGLGTRLGEIGKQRPKPMLKIGQHSIVEFGIANLVGHGIRDIVINTHHLASLFHDEIGDGRHLGARIQYIHEDVLLGTGGGLKNALHLLDPDKRNEPFVSLNGKLIFDLDLHAVIAAYHAAEAAVRAAGASGAARQSGEGVPDAALLGMMVVQAVPDAMAWGAVNVRKPAAVAASAAAPATDAAQARSMPPVPQVVDILHQGQHMFCGVHITRPSVVRALPNGEACMVRQGYLPWLQRGGFVAAYEHCPTGNSGYFAEHSTPERYLESERYLLAAADAHHRSKYGISSAADSPIVPMPLRFPPGRLLPRA